MKFNSSFFNVLVLLGVVTICVFLGESGSKVLLQEGGIVENLSALGYFVVVAIMLIKGRWEYLKSKYYFVFIALFCGLRELDFHQRFTTRGLFKTREYVSPDVPMIEKIIALTVILSLVAIIVIFLRKNFSVFISGLKRFDRVSLISLYVFVLLVASKSLDGLARKLSGFGIEVSEFSSFMFSATEEILELGIPLFMITGTLVYFKQHLSESNQAKEQLPVDEVKTA